MNNNILIKNENVYLSSIFLIEKGFNHRTLSNYMSNYNKGKSHLYEYLICSSNKKWLLFKAIPTKRIAKLGLPTIEEEFKEIYFKETHYNRVRIQKEIWLILSNSWDNPIAWKKFIPVYKDYGLDVYHRNILSKTHSLVQQIIALKKGKTYLIKDIHSVHLKFEDSIFRYGCYRYFSKKLINTQNKGITETLIHDFKLFGRTPYKLTPLVKSRILFHYSIPKKYSKKQIQQKVNEELIVRGIRTISYSSVTSFLNQNIIKNRVDMFRYGRNFAEKNSLPYLKRNHPTFKGEVFEIDSTRINIPYLDKNKGINYLNLCVMMDVFTRRIIGHSIDESENQIMIINCIKKAFETFKIIPSQLVHDNHKAYSSDMMTELRMKLEGYGVHMRNAKIRNAKDKAHVERWFRTFSSQYLNQVIGNLGYGITAKSQNSRASVSLETTFRNKKHLRNKEDLSNLISVLIKKYNTETSKKNELEKKESYMKNKKFYAWDIAKLFYKSKRIRVRRSKIIFQEKGISYHYTIYNTHQSNKLNNISVQIFFDNKDLSFIYAFYENEYQGCFKCDDLIDIIPSEKDLIIMNKHNHMLRKKITENFARLAKDIGNGENELNSIPILSNFNGEESLDKIISIAEDKLLLVEMINKEYPEIKKTIAKTTKTNASLPIITSRRKSKRNKIKMIEIDENF